MEQNEPDEVLVESWTLVEEDRTLLAGKSGYTRLGFALLLKFFEKEARFLESLSEIPFEAVAYVADQVKVDDATWSEYKQETRASFYHRSEIREFFGFRDTYRPQDRKKEQLFAPQLGPPKGSEPISFTLEQFRVICCTSVVR